jgi:hypothetical protein
MGTNWNGLKLLCETSINHNHPILQQSVRKAGVVDTSPDGVLVRANWREEEEWIGQRGKEPCDELVPSPATLILH